MSDTNSEFDSDFCCNWCWRMEKAIPSNPPPSNDLLNLVEQEIMDTGSPQEITDWVEMFRSTLPLSLPGTGFDPREDLVTGCD